MKICPAGEVHLASRAAACRCRFSRVVWSRELVRFHMAARAKVRSPFSRRTISHICSILVLSQSVGEYSAVSPVYGT